LPAAACYTVYDRSDRVVYQSLDAPVDMSRPLHETLPLRFPGGHMVFDTSVSCPVTTTLAGRGNTRDWTTRSPLLTNERTAEAMRVPHSRLEGGIALVRPGEATLPPALTVIPDTRLAASRSNTSAMGAGPARGPAIAGQRRPPATVEPGGTPAMPRDVQRTPARY
jgi:hypothetical protein